MGSFCLLITGFVLALLVLIMSAIEVHNGRKYDYRDVNCDKTDGSLFSLKSWCYVNGIFSLCVINLIGVNAAGVKKFGKTATAISIGVVCAIYILFEIAWTIPGAVQLFKYSRACKTTDTNLYNITFASLVIHWISLGVFFIGGLMSRSLLTDPDT